MATAKAQLPAKWRWFPEARFGMFIHFGPYAAYGRGEQVLFREYLDQREYARAAAKWNPKKYDPQAWARVARDAGMKYAVLTTRHHDGYCLWDSKLTDYTSAALAPKRDMVGEYVRAFREAGLRLGLYYSLADWRVSAYWAGARRDPEGWSAFREYVHGQVRELLTNYGKIDLVWFDGAWPNPAADWQSAKLVKMMRRLQPDVLINNRLGDDDPTQAGNGLSKKLGDYGTPEHQIVAENRLWESCQTSTWRLWGYTNGERFRPADQLLDMLVECAGQGGNLLLNVGPKADGTLPRPFVSRMEQIGRWMKLHGECIYGSQAGDVSEFITYGWQIRKGNNLYLVVRFWDGRETLHVAGLKTKPTSATLLTTGKKLTIRQEGEHLYLSPLPKQAPSELFPVIRLTFSRPPEPTQRAKGRLWGCDPMIYHPWAKKAWSGFGKGAIES